MILGQRNGSADSDRFFVLILYITLVTADMKRIRGREEERGEVLPYSAQQSAERLRPRIVRGVLLHACKKASGHSVLDLPNLAEMLLKSLLLMVLAKQTNLTCIVLDITSVLSSSLLDPLACVFSNRLRNLNCYEESTTIFARRSDVILSYSRAYFIWCPFCYVGHLTRLSLQNHTWEAILC